MRPPAGGRQYIYWHPSLYPFLRPPLRPYLGNVAKLIRRRRISLKRDNHGSTLIDVHTLPGKLALARFSVQQTEGLKVGCGEMRGWVSGGMGGWVGGGKGLRVGFININDMYNNDVGKGVVYAYEAYEAK